jgi:hypothetical protein
MRHIITATVAFLLGVGVSRLFWPHTVEAESPHSIMVRGEQLMLGMKRPEIRTKFLGRAYIEENAEEMLVCSGTGPTDPEFDVIAEISFDPVTNAADYISYTWGKSESRELQPFWAAIFGAFSHALATRKVQGMVYVATDNVPGSKTETISIDLPGRSISLTRIDVDKRITKGTKFADRGPLFSVSEDLTSSIAKRPRSGQK